MRILTCSCVLATLMLTTMTPPVSAAASEDAAARPAGIPAAARRVSELQIPDTEVWCQQATLYLTLHKLPEKQLLRIPRLANSIKTVYWQGAPQQPLNLKPEPAEWLIELAPLPPAVPAIIVMELQEPLTLFDENLVSAVDSDGICRLHASHARTQGTHLRFEPQPHKNTVGYWTNERDTAAWQFQIAAPGRYEVDILQGCGKGHGGSEVDVLIGSDQLRFTVQETGHFQNFVWRTVGTVELLGPKVHTLSLRPVRKAGAAVMDVRQIRLVPAGTTRSFAPELVDPAALPPQTR